ncbi:hypothetical protein CYMTET_2662 [Cymbomonas tetramitiformis]|uniref:Uncharacterized protein n=1 Tax=Cymbomonas tetramitiformis TaxID=36881 RepID=A0AAE0H4V7_9CHLO|nr:hypothetical protein CYMTET_2662 [Cymbomonas tetramitiformis]
MSETSQQTEEPELLCDPDCGRHVLFPIKHDDLFEFYKVHLACFWTVEEVDLNEDIAHWRDRLTESERRFVSYVLAFFAASDGVVLENLGTRFMAEVKLPEARQFYAVQMCMESIHAEMYSQLIQTLVTDPTERDRLFSSMSTVPCVREKNEWALRHVDSSRSFGERLVAFACVEGIFFSASFCAIFWLKSRGLMPGLALSNEFIARDEGLHRNFACALFRKLTAPPSSELVLEVVRGAVDAETRFARDALHENLIGMNAGSMCEYVRFVADDLLKTLGLPSHYHAKNPFPFMEAISLQGKTNFFERRVSEYQRCGVMAKLRTDLVDDRAFQQDVDF